MSIREHLEKVKKAQKYLGALDEQKRCQALEALATELRTCAEDIIIENQKDIQAAEASNLSPALIDRLRLDKPRLEALSEAILVIRDQPGIVGEVVETKVREDGLVIKKERVPLGVMAFIFESRPNVVIDATALAIKSANALVLKGGKEAYYTNTILGDVINRAFAGIIPDHVITVCDSKDRSLVKELITMKGLVDLVIPRGGEGLISYIYEHAKIPVMAHYKGLCHIFVDQSADTAMAKRIVINSKVQRPGVCNALETLLLHEDLPATFVKDLFEDLSEQGVELRLDEKLFAEYPQFSEARQEDWDTEYLDKILSVKQVTSCDAAIDHINMHGSLHTEAIVASDKEVIAKFKSLVDCSMVAINASTRFNDGGQLGLGAELGISTSKLHAYGPMGAREMTTTRFIVEGNGQIRS